MVLAVAPPRASTSSYLSSQFLSRESSLFKFFLANSRSDLHATSLAFFPLSSFSLPVSLLLFHPLTHRSPLPRSRSFFLRRRRRLPIPCSRCFSR